jgi:hypothetical protein
MRGNLAEVDALLRRLPEGDPYKVSAQKRAATFDHECGCAIGGTFLIAAAVLAAGYLLLNQHVTIGTLLAAAGFVFAAAIAGKLIGILVARIRMRLLHREVSVRIAKVEAGYVYLH